MKTIIETLNEILGEDIESQRDIEANRQYLTTLGEIQRCIKEYALEVIVELREEDYVTAIREGNDEFPSVIWNEDKLDKLIEQIERQ